MSVVIPAFNRRRWLAPTLESIGAQTFSDRETILVDDGSTDGSSAWVRRNHPAVRVVRLPRNMGSAAARNRGVAEARGALIAFLDSDDLWRPSYLDALITEFRDRRVIMAFSNVDRIDASGKVTARRVLRRSGAGICTPAIPASIVRRAAVVAEGGFDALFRSSLFDDVDFTARLALRHGPAGFRLVDRPLALCRVHAGQRTSLVSASPAAWLRGGTAGGDADRAARVDLAYLAFKHRSLLDDAEDRASLFELALRRASRRP